MRILKTRGGATIAVAVIIALSVVGGSHRSLISAAKNTSKVFYNGENGQSGAADFGMRYGLAGNLLVVADRYMKPEKTVFADLQTAIAAAKEAKDIWAVAKANDILESAVQAMYLSLAEYPLSEKDADYREEIHTDFESYGYTLRHDAYNAAAAEFNTEVLGGFPAKILGSLTKVPSLPTF